MLKALLSNKTFHFKVSITNSLVVLLYVYGVRQINATLIAIKLNHFILNLHLYFYISNFYWFLTRISIARTHLHGVKQCKQVGEYKCLLAGNGEKTKRPSETEERKQDRSGFQTNPVR